ncbi:MAG: NAD(P)/FAD-dependent oxidoreductase [Bacteroidota bacterium]
MTQISKRGPSVTIIGGGLAGLISSIIFAKSGISVELVEKKEYPFHRVCGEYVSNEVIPFLKQIDCFPEHLELPKIDKFLLSSTNGNAAEYTLDLGGFGISRYRFDQFLYEKASSEGVQFYLNTSVESISKTDNGFELSLNNGEHLKTTILVGAHGKRSKIDRTLDRAFWKKPAPYFGVKYHLKAKFSKDLIALHNFEGGYCGVSRIEDGKVNACYLGSTSVLKRFKKIEEMEERVVFKNPFLKDLFSNSEKLFDRPLTINEVSFHKKEAVEDGVFMCGDAAGLITPLCGNGMALAIHSAKVCAETILDNIDGGVFNRKKAESEYRSKWNALFKNRLRRGRVTQKLFGTKGMSSLAVRILKNSKLASEYIIKGTHGTPF